MRESQQLFFGGRLVSRLFEEFQHPAIQTKIVQHFGGFLKSNRSAPANRKKGFYTKPCAEKAGARLEAFFYEAAQNFKVF